jgi:hypothetical protein
MAEAEKRAAREARVISTWDTWRPTVREIAYELGMGYVVNVVWLVSLQVFGVFGGILARALSVLALGTVLGVGLGVVANPLVTLEVMVIHLIDDDLEADQSRPFFAIKSIVKALVSGAGAALAGLSARAVFGGLLPAGLMPANLMAGSGFATGLVVFFLVMFENHISAISGLYADDGYGLYTAIGVGQFALGLVTFAIWQVQPDLNSIFAMSVATLSWSTFAWWFLLVVFAAGIVVVLLYYVFLNDVFSMTSKKAAQANNVSDDMAALLTTQNGSSKTAASKFFQ